MRARLLIGNTFRASVRPNEAATGEAKYSPSSSRRRGGGVGGAATGKQYQAAANAAKTQTTKEAAAQHKMAEKRREGGENEFGLKFAYEQILRCFIKFATQQDESKTSGNVEDFMAGKINEHLIGLVGSEAA